MRTAILVSIGALTVATAAHAQEIVEVPASKADVARPDDLFALPSGQWFIARQVSQGSEPCTPEACEAGFNSGDLVVSVEHAKEYVRVISGFRGCERVAFQEIKTGERPGKSRRKQVSELMKDVNKGAESSCKLKAPSVPPLDVASLFPNPTR